MTLGKPSRQALRSARARDGNRPTLCCVTRLTSNVVHEARIKGKSLPYEISVFDETNSRRPKPSLVYFRAPRQDTIRSFETQHGGTIRPRELTPPALRAVADPSLSQLPLGAQVSSQRETPCFTKPPCLRICTRAAQSATTILKWCGDVVPKRWFRQWTKSPWTLK